MTTLSGTANFNINRNEIITEAYEIMGVVGEGETATASQITTAARKLNMLIKTLHTTGVQLWTFKNFTLPMVLNQRSYTIGPAPADLVDLRPLKIIDDSHFIRTLASNNDVPVIQISRREYELLGQKLVTGVPNQIYYDPQLDRGVLFVYPVPSASLTHSLIFTVQRPLQDINLLAENADFPQEWLLPLAWLLANELSLSNVLPEFMVKHIREQANMYRESLSDFDSMQDNTAVFFQPMRSRR